MHELHSKFVRLTLQGLISTARKRSLGQGNMFTGVCLSTGGGGGVPGGDTPRDGSTAVGGTHPTGMHSCYDIRLLTLQFFSSEPSIQSVSPSQYHEA